MSFVIKHCDEMLAKHHHWFSPSLLAVAFVAIFGFVSPTLIYAAEVTSSATYFVPQPQEFRPEKPRILFSTSSLPGAPSSTIEKWKEDGKWIPSSTERILQFKTARIQTLKEALMAIEQQAKELRTDLENLQYANTTSTEALNLGQFNKKINALLAAFKKTNFNLELPKLKAELKSELVKREAVQKQMEAQREAFKKAQEQFKNQEIKVPPMFEPGAPAPKPTQ